MTSGIRPADLRAALSAFEPPEKAGADYQIAKQIGPAFVGRSKLGAPALLIPLEAMPAGSGRQGGGFTLVASKMSFDHQGRKWQQPAAAFECTDPSLLDAFCVLVSDLLTRLPESELLNWPSLLSYVEDWQALLAKRSLMTPEAELGLWGELWLISRSVHPDLLVAAWRGPESEAVDFFMGGIGLEVKASRRRLLHHVSQSQLARPVGDYQSALMSIWVGVDPERGQSLTELVDFNIQRLSDSAALLRKLVTVGYVPVDREQYQTKWLLLETPAFFAFTDVPRVTAADPGVSQLRYVVTLDQERAKSATESAALWRHFTGVESNALK